MAVNRRAVLASSTAVAVSGLTGAAWWLSRKPSPAAGPSLRITYNSEEQSAEKSQLGQVLQSQLAAADIPVTLEPLTSSAYNDAIGLGAFQSALTLWYLDYADPEGFLTDFYSKSGYRLSKYADPAYDEVYLQGLFAATAAAKSAAFKQAVDLIDDQRVWVPLYANDELFLLTPAAHGFRSNAYQYYDYRAVDRDEVRAATDIEVQTLDPALAYDLASKHIVTQSYEGLIALGPDSRIQPSLARGWTLSQNGRELVFDLRPGVKFHPSTVSPRGRAMTARDVKSSFERTALSSSPYAYVFDHVEGVEAFRAKQASEIAGLVASSDLEFRIRLSKSFPTMLPWLLAPAAAVMPADLPADYDFARGSCGTGPFVLTAWDGTRARFRAHEGYRSADDAPVRPRTLTITVMKDPSVQLLAYGRGELDVLNLAPALFGAVLNGNGGLQTRWAASELRRVALNNLKFLAFNMQQSPWGMDKALRKRVADAIDRNAIVQQLFRGYARAATSVLPPGAFS